jgi:hypothetical protein
LASRTPRPFTTYKLVSRSTLNETPSKILRYLPGCSYQPYQPSQQSQAYLVHIHPSTVLLCLASGCQVLHPLLGPIYFGLSRSAERSPARLLPWPLVHVLYHLSYQPGPHGKFQACSCAVEIRPPCLGDIRVTWKMNASGFMGGLRIW